MPSLLAQMEQMAGIRPDRTSRPFVLENKYILLQNIAVILSLVLHGLELLPFRRLQFCQFSVRLALLVETNLHEEYGLSANNKFR